MEEYGALFRSIHSLLLEQAKGDKGFDTENQLAERFNTSRYKVRLVLDQLAQMGVLERTQKKGMKLLSLSPEKFADKYCQQIVVADFGREEVLEARRLSATETLPICIRRASPIIIGQLEEKIQQMITSLDYHAAAVRFHFMFHRTFLSAVGNRLLFGTGYGLLLYLGDLIDSRAHFDHDAVASLVEADRGLLDCMRSQNLTAASEFMEKVLSSESALLTNQTTMLYYE